MTMPGRSYSSTGSSYKYGMNGQEKTKELGENFYEAQYWEYDSRIGRRWNVDPKPNISISPYAVFENNPIWFNDPLGDSIVDPNRTKGKNFIVVANKKLRDQDIAEHGGSKIRSAYYIDYKKALKMARKSKGTLTVIEAENAKDATDQIIKNLGSDGYVKNLTIDFHSGLFGEDDFNGANTKSALNSLAAGYAGDATTCYLGMCWAGGNPDMGKTDLTKNASQWLDGATVYGNKAAASSFSFFLKNTFIGPIWEDYAKGEDNMKYFGQHTVSFRHPQLQVTSSMTIKDRIKIQNSGQIFNPNKQPVVQQYNENLFKMLSTILRFSF